MHLPRRLMLLDTVLYVAVFCIVLSLRAHNGVEAFLMAHAEPFAIIFFVYLLTLFLVGLYDADLLVSRSFVFGATARASIFLFFIAIALFYAVPSFGVTPKTNLALFFGVLFVALYTLRAYGLRTLAHANTKAILVGDDELLEKTLSKDSLHRIVIVATLPADASAEHIIAQAQKHAVRHIILNFEDAALGKTKCALEHYVFSGYTFLDTQEVKENILGRVDVERADERWFFRHIRAKTNFASTRKRVFDIFIALLLLPVLVVLTPFVTVMIVLFDRHAPLIAQKRYGLNRREITLYKFRTMHCNDDGEWHGEKKNVVTRFGTFLRKTRIDELPQLVNVIRGDISLIGPRPDMIVLGDKLAREIPHYMMRYSIRPGLSGWAQVSQKEVPQSVAESTERLAYDLFYIKHASLLLDIKIAFQTARRVLREFGV